VVTPETIAQLEALGGAWTGAVSQWGSYEIYTPLCDPEPVVWCTPAALASLIEEWQQQPLCRPPMRVWLGKCDDRPVV
jgi:hypothetical protein